MVDLASHLTEEVVEGGNDAVCDAIQHNVSHKVHIRPPRRRTLADLYKPHTACFGNCPSRYDQQYPALEASPDMWPKPSSLPTHEKLKERIFIHVHSKYTDSNTQW
jgi:hypothetical protein